jgi:two-component system response regulator YesN
MSKMAIKVLILDDEKLERVLIRRGFHWEENGFEIIGEAGSAQEALECMRICRPHIIITDINMPNMNGLQFVSAALKEFKDSNIRYVIITGYRDFEYARQAVKLGVEDFLLKPISIADLFNTVMKLKDEIQRVEEEKNELKQLKESFYLNRNIAKESFLQRLVENRVSEQEAMNKLNLYEFQSIAKNCLCCNINIDNKPDQEDKTVSNSEQVLAMVKAMKPEPVVAFVHYLGNVIAYYSSVDYEQLRYHLEFLQTEIKERFSVSVNIGISNIHTGFEGIYKAYREADKALSTRIIMGQNRCIIYEDYLKYRKTINLTDIDWEDFIFSVKNCLDTKVDNYVNRYMLHIREAQNRDLQWLKFMTVNILTKGELTLHKNGKSLTDLEGLKNYSEQIDNIDSLEDMQEVIISSLAAIMEFHKSTRPKKGKPVIEQALEVIHEHLYDPDLSLSMVASKIYTNDSYLSRIFKQEMKESLIEFIVKKRIEESIHLLNTTDLKVYEVAEKIGIKDPHYFSICFKKQVGVTVKEYRKPQN